MRGTSSQAFTACAVPSPSSDRLQFGVGRQQRLSEDVVEGEEAHEGDDDGLVDRAADAGGAAGGGHPLVTADDRDDRAEQGALEDRAPEVGDRGLREEGGEEASEALVVEDLGEDAAGEAGDDGVDVEQAGDQHQRQEARHDQVLDRIDAEHLQGVELLADFPRPEVCRDRGAGDAGDDDTGDEGADFSDRGKHEEAAQPVERAEQREEVGGLQAGGAEVDRHGRDQQREPAELQGEEELPDELLAIGIGRTHRRGDRSRGEDHHLPHLFEQRPGGPECPIHHGSAHQLLRRAAPHERGAPLAEAESKRWVERLQAAQY